ncbi:flippase [Pseudomonas jessenii]|uniref:flippase n=1 Tax=Pseudomonas jessenii TaxID=77298 RepID=UPI0030C20578
MLIGKRIINQLCSLASKGVELGKIFILNVLSARSLGAEDFGTLSFIISVATVMGVITEFRVQDVMIKRISMGENESKIITNAICICLSFSTIGFLITTLFSCITDINISWKNYLALYSVIFIASSLKVFKYAFIANRNNIANCAVEVTSLIASLGFYLLFFSEELTINSYIYIRIFDAAMVSTLGFVMYKIAYKFKLTKPSLVNIRSIIVESGPLVLSGFVVILLQKIDQIMIKYMLGNYELGIYSSAANIITVFSIAPMLISQTNSPAIFRLTEGSVEYRKTRMKYIRNIAFLGLAMSFILLGASKYIINILYGEAYAEAETILKISFLTPFIIALGAASSQIIIADNNSGIVFYKSIMALILGATLNFILIPLMGIEGAAISTLLAMLLSNVASNIFIKKYKYIWHLQCDAILLKDSK